MIITMGGDICSTDANREMYANKETKKLFNDVLDVFAQADYNIINLECAITESEHRIRKFGPNLKSPLNTAAVLKEAGITHIGLSNNHTFDFGIPGIKDTMAELDKYGIAYTGIGENDIDARKNLIIEKDGIKIALITVCEHEYSYALPDRLGAREYDPYDTNDDIAEAKKTADYVVVMYHGGKELCRYPSPRLRKLCRSMATHGADIVLCQHSHCIGCYENFKDCHILYGQGNFHFVKLAGMANEMWDSGLLLKFDITKDKCDITFIPTVVSEGTISLAKGEEKETILKEFEARNEELQNGEWLKGWHEFCEDNRPNYTTPLSTRDYDHFSHYLDCEAHTDVWRELFPTWNKSNEKPGRL